MSDNLFGLLPEEVPNWLARVLLYLVILVIGSIGYNALSAMIVTPSDVLKKLESIEMRVGDIQRTQERNKTLLEIQGNKIDRLEDRINKNASSRHRSDREE